MSWSDGALFLGVLSLSYFHGSGADTGANASEGAARKPHHAEVQSLAVKSPRFLGTFRYSVFVRGTRWLMGLVPLSDHASPTRQRPTLWRTTCTAFLTTSAQIFCPSGGSVERACHFCLSWPISASPPWPLPWFGPGSATFPPLTRFPRTDRALVGGTDVLPANLAVARPLQAWWGCASDFLVMVISLSRSWSPLRPRTLPGSTRGCW